MNNMPNTPVFYDGMVSDFEAAMLMENGKERDVEIQQLEDHYKSQNWITNSLHNEITSLYPTSVDIDLADNNKRDLGMFKEKVGKFCYPGRCFVTCFQFHQSMKLLCSQWNISTIASCNSIRCHYRERKQKFVIIADPVKRCKRQVLCCDCPFAVRYSIPGLVRNKKDEFWKPRVLYKVTIFMINKFGCVQQYFVISHHA